MSRSWRDARPRPPPPGSKPSTPNAVLAGPDLYLRLPHGVQGSRLSNARIESLLGVPATLRNWRTVVALVELAAEA